MADTSLIESNIGLLIWKASNLWQSKLRDIKCPNDKNLFGLLVSHIGYVDYNVYKRCNCNSGGIQFGSNIDSHTFLKFEKIFSFSLRII